MKEKTRVIHPIDTVIDSDSKIIILGSFPSVKSREKSFFYMNKYNRFYQVLSELFNEDFYSCEIKEKINLLHKYHIALDDVVKECNISLSSDSSIEPIKIIDIDSVIKQTKIKTIFFNGNKAYELFIKEYPNYQCELIKLPSTSSANAKMSLSNLVEKWKIIKDKLN